MAWISLAWTGKAGNGKMMTRRFKDGLLMAAAMAVVLAGLVSLVVFILESRGCYRPPDPVLPSDSESDSDSESVPAD